VFEWDPKKANSNKIKHEVSFEEAGTAFFDSAGIDGEDIDHSTAEARRCHGHEKSIRVISARLANRKEKTRYQEAKD
jgi:uncharacterized protein